MVRAMEKLNIVCIFPALHSAETGGECSLKMTVPDLRRGDESAQCSVVAWLSSSWSLVEVITSLICIVTGYLRLLRTHSTTPPPQSSSIFFLSVNLPHITKPKCLTVAKGRLCVFGLDWSQK